jgi:hypothetical protein
VSAANIVGIIPATQLPANVITNGASGVNITGTFTGNGFWLTNLNSLQLTIQPNSNNYQDTSFGQDALLLEQSQTNHYDGITNYVPGTTAFGFGAGAHNQPDPWSDSGKYNTFYGWMDFYFNTLGNHNTGNGRGAGYYNTIGSYLTFNGEDAGFNNVSGSNIVASGDHALQDNVSGQGQTATGSGALRHSLNNWNTANGHNAGVATFGSGDVVNDYELTLNGALSGVDTNGPYHDSSAVGFNSIITTNNQVVLGDVHTARVDTTGTMNAPAYTGNVGGATNASGTSMNQMLATNGPLNGNFLILSTSTANTTNTTTVWLGISNSPSQQYWWPAITNHP